ncbi:hypothetical protein [Halomonas halmophila]|nr:hypothetical protein [Halomonas halmophila]
MTPNRCSDTVRTALQAGRGGVSVDNGGYWPGFRYWFSDGVPLVMS